MRKSIELALFAKSLSFPCKYLSVTRVELWPMWVATSTIFKPDWISNVPYVCLSPWNFQGLPSPTGLPKCLKHLCHQLLIWSSFNQEKFGNYTFLESLDALNKFIQFRQIKWLSEEYLLLGLGNGIWLSNSRKSLSSKYFFKESNLWTELLSA